MTESENHSILFSMKEYVRRMISEKTELSARIEKAKKAVEHPPYGMTVCYKKYKKNEKEIEL